MIFSLKEATGHIPEFEYKDVGKELACYVPNETDWEQLNYGQGEGQILAYGCVWGFYFGDSDTFSVQLHKGSIELNKAIEFVEHIKSKMYGSKADNVEIKIVGSDQE